MNQDNQPVHPSIKKDNGYVYSGFIGKCVEKVSIVFSLGILMSAAILVIEVFLRYALNSPTIWAHETVIFLNASAFIFGGLFVASRNDHIRVVLIYDNLSAKSKRLMEILISTTCLISTAMFAWAAWLMVKKAAWKPTGEFHLETSGSAWNPPIPGMLKIFLLMVLMIMAAQFLIITVNHLRNKREQ